MTTGSIGAHRAFMGVSLTLCVCLALVLFLGWRYYFDVVAQRDTLIAIAAREEARSADLEKMGLTIDAGKTAAEAAVPDAARLVLENQKPDAPQAAAPSESTPAVAGSVYPRSSTIKEMPFTETSVEVMQAVTLLEQYWATPSWHDRAAMVVDSARVSPLMKDFYETQRAVDPVPGGLISKARYSINDTEILYFRYNGNRIFGTLEVAMRRGDEGRFLVDWESLVGYSEMSFKDLREKRPVTPVLLRVFAREFEYYNFEFSDAAKYLCVKLTSENGEQSVYGYAERGTVLADWLSASLLGTGPTGMKGFTVRVAFPPEAQSNQCVKLLQVVESRWLVLP